MLRASSAALLLSAIGVVCPAAAWELIADPDWSHWTVLWVVWQSTPFLIVALALAGRTMPVAAAATVTAATLCLTVLADHWLAAQADPLAYFLVPFATVLLSIGVASAVGLWQSELEGYY